MTDIHTHILFNTDDGAKDIETSVRMLEMEIADGVDTVVLTPHFDPSKHSIADFVKARNERISSLKSATKGKISLVCGAEVVASPFLDKHKDLGLLCIEGTKALLIELPDSDFSIWVEEMVYRLELSGYTPILAHIERYKDLRNLELLKKLCDMGCITQVNCSFFSSPKFSDRRFIKKAAKRGLLHVLGSDCHSDSWRPPCLKQGLVDAESLISSEFSKQLMENTDTVAKKGKLPERFFII